MTAKIFDGIIINNLFSIVPITLDGIDEDSPFSGTHLAVAYNGKPLFLLTDPKQAGDVLAFLSDYDLDRDGTPTEAALQAISDRSQWAHQHVMQLV